jgi:FKBP-type peptidyl-prolyl cis-trans isomerase (trigger factor)
MTDKVTNHTKNNFKTIKTILKDASVQIEVRLEWEDAQKYRKHVIKELQGKVNLPGFRRGHVPEHVLVRQVGDAHIFEEIAEHAIEAIYPEVLSIENVKPLAFPKIEIKKIEEGAPIEFTITVDIFPEIKLADYKKIAIKENSKKVEALSVIDGEVEKAIEMIWNQQTNQNNETTTKMLVDDNFAVSMGATDLADFKEKVKSELLAEKGRKQTEKKRLAILEEILSESTIELPDTLVKEELMRMKAQMGENLAQMNLSFDTYLTKLKKTQDELFTEWRTDAEKRVRFELTLANIAESESISPSDDDVEKEAKHIMTHYKDISIDQAWSYATNQLRKQKTFEFLENLR